MHGQRERLQLRQLLQLFQHVNRNTQNRTHDLPRLDVDTQCPLSSMPSGGYQLAVHPCERDPP